jgi:hypothetical protein
MDGKRILKEKTGERNRRFRLILNRSPRIAHEARARSRDWKLGEVRKDKRDEPMNQTRIRTAERGDLARITNIYNHYILNTPSTFDVEAYTVERREAWMAQFSATGRYRLIVAEENGVVMGYAGTTRFRPKAAYETTVETSIYCAPEAVGKGVGKRLYAELFEMLRGETFIVL